MAAKKSPTACDGRAKVDFKELPALNSAATFQSQQLNFQASHIERRFGIDSAALAACIAHLAFGEVAR